MSVAEIKAIETEYAGCRFRSRLEARWAVFFDNLGVRWLYEPQGYVLGHGEPYLPDFWLPDAQLWVEVKGAASTEEWIKIFAATAADGLPLVYGRDASPVEALGKDDIRRIPILHRIVLLGEVPRLIADAGWGHIVTSLTPNGPSWHEAFFWPGSPLIQIGREWPWPSSPEFVQEPASMGGRSCPFTRPSVVTARAYDVARKARFEHGERG